MNTYKIIAKNVYIIITIVMAAGLYIYITKDLEGESFIGYCFFAIGCVFSFTIYQSSISLYDGFVQMKVRKLTAKSEPVISSVNSTIDMEQNIAAEDSMESPAEKSQVALKQEANVQTIKLTVKPSESDIQSKQKIVEDLTIYTQNLLGQYFTASDMDALVQILTDYAEGKTPTPILRNLSELNGLKPKDLYHYGWNIWVRLKPMSRRSTCVFLKKAFPNILEDSSVQTIYSKMMDDCYVGAVRNIALHEDLALSYNSAA